MISEILKIRPLLAVLCIIMAIWGWLNVPLPNMSFLGEEEFSWVYLPPFLAASGLFIFAFWFESFVPKRLRDHRNNCEEDFAKEIKVFEQMSAANNPLAHAYQADATANYSRKLRLNNRLKHLYNWLRAILVLTLLALLICFAVGTFVRHSS